jgi:hypothetical protein
MEMTMKSTIILLATIAGIGIGATPASAGDAQNLSCRTEIADDGKIVRDCGPEQAFYQVIVISAPTTPPPTPPAAMHDGGGKKSDGPDHGDRGERGGTIH